MLKRALFSSVVSLFVLVGAYVPTAVAGEVEVGSCPVGFVRDSEGDCVYLLAVDDATSFPNGNGTKKGGAPVCREANDEGSELPLCYREPYGRWNDTRKCWARRADPQPDFDRAIWEGRKYGAIYNCYSETLLGFHQGIQGGIVYVEYWSSEGQVDLEALARQAVDAMYLEPPVIGLTGYGKPESLQLLGLPTWMWAADPGESTTGPITRSASAGAVTVTATGRLTATVWQMGDGSVVTCAGPNAAGTPYDGSYGGAPSPTCGYRYGWTSAREPGGAFTVTVTANWEVEWSGGGGSGVITRSVVRSTQLRVGEVQVITDRRG